MSFELTPSQAVAEIRIKEFLKKPVSSNFDDRVLVLTGKAGTGKTTLLKHALKELIDEDIKSSVFQEDIYTQSFFRTIPNVLGVAVAHKAKIRLQESIPNAITYTGYFGIKPEWDDNGVVKFKHKKRTEFEPTPPAELPYLVVVHDEVSMYDMNMINLLEKFVNKDSKILLVGDSHQLPPIIEDKRRASDLDSPAFNFFSNKIELTERVRQTAGNPILDLSDEITKEIKGGKNVKRIVELFSTDRFNNGVGYRKIDKKDLVSDFIKSYSESFDSRVICYKNVTINRINNKIRSKLFNNPDEKYVPGDALYMNLTYINPDKIPFFNSEELIIEDILEYSEYWGVKASLAVVERDGIRSSLWLVDHEGEAQYDFQVAKRKKAMQTAEKDKIGLAKKEYMEFKNAFADVSYGYAFTCYKIQGSSAKNVYVDVADILSVPISDKRKLQTLYTAITRATHQVIFF